MLPSQRILHPDKFLQMGHRYGGRALQIPPVVGHVVLLFLFRHRAIVRLFANDIVHYQLTVTFAINRVRGGLRHLRRVIRGYTRGRDAVIWGCVQVMLVVLEGKRDGIVRTEELTTVTDVRGDLDEKKDILML